MLKSLYRIISSPVYGKDINDKCTLGVFSLQWACCGFLTLLGKESRPHLARGVTVKRLGCLYLCRKDTDDPAVILSPKEDEQLQYVQNNLKEGIFIDVGAHIGLYSVLASKILGNRGKVISIEPEPSNVAALNLNLLLNELSNVEAKEAAAHYLNGADNLFVPYNKSTSWSSLIPIYNPTFEHKKVKVKRVRLDDLVSKEEYKNVSIVKIDTERTEGSVIKGMEGIMRGGNPIVLVEYLPGGFEEYLSHLGYAVKEHKGFKEIRRYNGK